MRFAGPLARSESACCFLFPSIGNGVPHPYDRDTTSNEKVRRRSRCYPGFLAAGFETRNTFRVRELLYQLSYAC